MTAVITEEVGLQVRNLGLTYRTAQRPVFSGLSFDLGPRDRLAILGRNGQGKSTLIKLLGGVMSPTHGRIRWNLSQSWPIGFHGGFQGSLSGLDNIRFLARIYGRNFVEVRDRVDDFAELGRSLRLPVKHYSSGMRARLAFGLSLAIEFECYLVDELVAVGDARFQRKCQHELFERRAERAFLLASHNVDLISSYCDRALLVESGKAKVFEDIEEAVEIYKWLRTA